MNPMSAEHTPQPSHVQIRFAGELIRSSFPLRAPTQLVIASLRRRKATVRVCWGGGEEGSTATGSLGRGRLMRPILVSGIARSGGSWVSTMLAASGQVVHVNEPLNRRHPPGLSPGILRIPPPRAYQYIAEHNEPEFRPGYTDLFRLKYHLMAELRRN